MMKKLLAVTLIIAMLIAVFAGCAKPVEQPEPSAPEPAKTEEQNVTSGTESPEEDTSIKSDVQGTLNGRIDNNSVEIEMNPEGPLAFRVTDVLDQLDGINDGDIVKFTYVKNENGQLNVTKIERMR
jgi:PBP1b-binding outer membrane lipoprotein LpoB